MDLIAMTNKSSNINAGLIRQLQSNNRVPWLGELLLSNNLINLEQLNTALNNQRNLALQGHWKPLGEILVDMNLISHYDLEMALRSQSEKRNNTETNDESNDAS